MINKIIDSEIINAFKAHNDVKKKVLTEIKGELLNYTKSKEGKNCDIKDIPDAKVITILKKIESTHQESIDTANGRESIILEHTVFINALSEYLPKAASKDEIEKAINEVLATGIEPIKKNMGPIINKVKASLPTADGKLVAQLVIGKLN